MSFVYEVSRLNGSIMTNGLTRGGVLVDVLTCPAGNSSSKSYPRTHKAGLTYYFARAGAHQITLVDQIGTDGTVQGTVKWDWSVNGWQQDTVLYVFAKKLDSVDLFGIQLTNDAGEIFADTLYPSPQFAGTVQLGATASMSYTTPDGYTASVHQATVNLRSGSDKMVLMYLPDVGTNDTWYHLRKEYVLASEGSTVVEVVVYTKAPSYTLPSLHVYAVNYPISSVSPFTVQVSTPSQQVTYDAAVEGFSSIDELQVQYVGVGSTTTYTLPSGYTLGMSVPYYKRSAKVANGSRFDETVEVGVGKRIGIQLTLNILRDTFRTVATSTMSTYTVGGTQLRYSPVADVSQITPTNIAGTRASQLSSAPVLTSSPASAAVHPGDTVAFSVAVSGYPTPSLQWYFNGNPVLGSAGTGTSYVRTTSLSDDGSTVYCVATNSLGTTQSASASLFVNYVEATHITSTTGPTGGTVGDRATFSMAATGSPTPTCTISGPGGIAASGIGSCSVTVTLTASMSGTIVYHAENTDGSFHTVADVNSPLTVTSPQAPATPVFSQSPTSQSVVQGGSVSLFATASPVTSYVWFNSSYAQVGSGQSYSPPTSTVGSVTYFCRAYNGSSFQDSNSATITVTAPLPPPVVTTPVFDLQPHDLFITAGQDASFSCHASPANRYQWYQNSVQMSGQTGSSIYLPARDTGWNLVEFYCVAFNDTANGTAQNTSSTGVLHVAPATAPTTYSRYYNPGDYYDSGAGTVSWGAGGSSTDSGPWAEPPGDASLYDIQATSAGGVTPNGSSYGVWYSMGSGASWSVTASTGTNRVISFNWSIRLRSTGSVVSSGYVNLTSGTA